MQQPQVMMVPQRYQNAIQIPRPPITSMVPR